MKSRIIVFLSILFFIISFCPVVQADRQALFDTVEDAEQMFDRYYPEIRDFWGGMITPKYRISGGRRTDLICPDTQFRHYHSFAYENGYGGRYEAYLYFYVDRKTEEVEKIRISTDNVKRNKECRHRFQTVALVVGRMLGIVYREFDFEKQVFLPLYDYDRFLIKSGITNSDIEEMFFNMEQNKDYSNKIHFVGEYKITIYVSLCNDNISLEIEKTK